jgi:hypothetical protein
MGRAMSGVTWSASTDTGTVTLAISPVPGRPRPVRVRSEAAKTSRPARKCEASTRRVSHRTATGWTVARPGGRPSRAPPSARERLEAMEGREARSAGTRRGRTAHARNRRPGRWRSLRRSQRQRVRRRRDTVAQRGPVCGLAKQARCLDRADAVDVQRAIQALTDFVRDREPPSATDCGPESRPLQSRSG